MKLNGGYTQQVRRTGQIPAKQRVCLFPTDYKDSPARLKDPQEKQQKEPSTSALTDEIAYFHQLGRHVKIFSRLLSIVGFVLSLQSVIFKNLLMCLLSTLDRCYSAKQAASRRWRSVTWKGHLVHSHLAILPPCHLASDLLVVQSWVVKKKYRNKVYFFALKCF